MTPPRPALGGTTTNPLPGNRVVAATWFALGGALRAPCCRTTASSPTSRRAATSWDGYGPVDVDPTVGPPWGCGLGGAELAGASGIYAGLEIARLVAAATGSRWSALVAGTCSASVWWRLTSPSREACCRGLLLPWRWPAGSGSRGGGASCSRSSLFGPAPPAPWSIRDGGPPAGWLVPDVPWMWVNLHGSFPVGIAAGRGSRPLPWVSGTQRSRGADWLTVGGAAAALGSVVGALLVAQLGVDLILTFPVKLLGRSEVLQLHPSSWQQSDPRRPKSTTLVR